MKDIKYGGRKKEQGLESRLEVRKKNWRKREGRIKGKKRDDGERRGDKEEKEMQKNRGGKE
jgi:hypothetical protein